MNTDYNDLFIMNDLSVDREAFKKVKKPIPNTNGWMVDNRGIVYNSRGKPAATEPLWNGSVRCRVSTTSGQVYMYVNALVLTAFGIEKPSPDHAPWHRDGDRTNNSLVNLSWQVLTRQTGESDD